MENSISLKLTKSKALFVSNCTHKESAFYNPHILDKHWWRTY